MGIATQLNNVQRLVTYSALSIEKRARLWFGDGAANSHFDATIESMAFYYLVDNFGLITMPGGGPRAKIDQAAGAKCSPYKVFGAWNYTLTP